MDYMKTAKVSFNCPTTTVEILDRMAEEDHRDRSSLLNKIIDFYLQFNGHPALVDPELEYTKRIAALKKLPKNCKPCKGTGIFTEAGVRRACNTCGGTGHDEDGMTTTTKKAGAR